MANLIDLAHAIEGIQTRLLAADAACIEAINSLMLERDDLIQHIATSMNAAADRLERHRTLIHNLLNGKEPGS